MQNDLAKLQRSPREVARWQKAQQQLLGGRAGLALVNYRELAKNFPTLARIWFEMGVAAATELDFPLAYDSFKKTEELGCNDVKLLLELSLQYHHRLRRMDHARACCERAVMVEPKLVRVRQALATALETERRLDEAWECIEQCSAENPKDPQTRYFRAFMLNRKGRNTEAETVLRDLIAGSETQEQKLKIGVRHLLGQVLDELGQYKEAMKWMAESKAVILQTADIPALEKEYEAIISKRRKLLAELTPAMIQRWREEASSDTAGRYRMAFLGGHPRSGTTLVEQILGAHPSIHAYDEPESFTMEVEKTLVDAAGPNGVSVAKLNGLSAEERSRMRERYWKSLFRESLEEPKAEMLLDKNPTPTVSLHLWLRVFPELKVIIPLRDPRDVVISCYFQNLVENVNFLRLERVAKHYADLMDVWLRMKELGGFDWIETKYEDVVNDLEGEGRRLTEFLGLAWHPAQANFQESSRRKFMYAPTYNDVTKPVHKRAIGRWDHYAEALEPIQARLAPYCRAFGYSC